MTVYTETINRLIQELQKLPGIGPKSAQRLAFYILQAEQSEADMLAKAILELKSKVRYCSTCFNITEDDSCAICKNSSRDRGIICVLEQPSDLIAIERTGEYKGLYHILLGSLSPLEGINPSDLKIRELLERLKKGETREIIVATNPDVEGEATAMYLARLIKPLGIKVTRIAHGLPVGGALEYADEVTLTRAIEGRTTL